MDQTKSWTELFEASLPRQCPQIYEKLKLWHLEVEERAKVIWENLSKFTELKGKTFLDFGCGEGGMAIYFARLGVRVFAAEITPAQLERVRLRAQEKGVQLTTWLINENGQIPELQDEQFDVILCHDVIEHCPEPKLSLREMKRLLKRKGLIYLTTPNRLGLAWIFSDPHYLLPLVSLLPQFLNDPLVRKFRKMKNDVVHLFTPLGLSRLFRKTGLKIIYSYPDEVKEKILRPDKIKSQAKLKIFKVLNQIRAVRLILLLLPVLHLFSNSLIYILTKEE